MAILKLLTNSLSFWGQINWMQPRSDRRDPLDILEAQNEQRLPWLVGVRHARMSASPFTFFRGAAALMAEDLAGTPDSGIRVQCGGDAHLSNFGAYASPSRELVFDANDFDETLPGPWEWDLKRLAASFVVGGRGKRKTASIVTAPACPTRQRSIPARRRSTSAFSRPASVRATRSSPHR